MLTWKSLKVIWALALMMVLTSFPHVQSKALTFDSKKLESSSQLWWSHHREILSPRFDDTPQNITALVGDSAFLPCTVAHLGDRSVTWMRQRDLHILTAGVYTYSADERFRVLHPENSDDWTLHIKYATLRDSGIYECQVNSDPKISRKVTLTVKDSQLDDPVPYGMATTDIPPEVAIEGPQERHIQRGSVLAITCVVRHPPHSAPGQVLWFHGTENIDYDSPRGGVSIQTEKSNRKTVSKLMLATVTDNDNGEYSCSPTDLPPAVVAVHVQSGQLQQPVKQGPGLSGAAVTASISSALLVLLMMTLACVRCRVFN
ncbi:zwei Ig domain protein zig-8-like isoform X3 [Macrobrachium nipponense]|uniref:zwei Ig domain protein zig-8-like isoform X3 n=1 Tax=Macrobrachium nipponense TaxID=159736 RepID=UPI0030C8927B